MRTQQLEAWVLDIVEHVVSGRRYEDDRVELKAAWPTDFRKTARQIAGQANRAGGETILWIIGIDEDAHRLTNPEPAELANWWPTVGKCFCELAPEMDTINVATKGHVLVALQFDTNRAPYMISWPGGRPDLEIPWREGNRTRSARRSEILQSLVAEVGVPSLELIHGAAAIDRMGHPSEDPYGNPTAIDPVEVKLDASLVLYVDALESLALPQHRWSARASLAGIDITLSMDVMGPHRYAYAPSSARAEREEFGFIRSVPGSGLRVEGPDIMHVELDAILDESVDMQALKRAQVMDISLSFPIAGSTRAATLQLKLRKCRISTRNPNVRSPGTPIAHFSHDQQPHFPTR
ncbi:MAG: hypothetical protein QOI06_238 [Nocardioidaceae bacterium]|nr:hypothetical protein [Nocardioidaceae bacterium]